MTLNAVYKCRLCGKRYENGTVTGNGELAFRALLDATIGIKSSEPLAPAKHEPHFCRGESIGVADFLGWEAKK